MTEPTRGVRARRGNRRPGSLLLTALLGLAIVASSALVFTNKVELLKLAVIISLWAAVAAAFVSFIYRRQSDIDQAKSRDLKLVYDLQLDREISARREYELSIESQLRRELASELRAETSDEVAALRAELAALRTNLEIIFDTDLQSRPAIENERTTVHTFGDWGSVGQSAAASGREDRSIGPGRVISSRIDTEEPEEFDFDPNTEESPIIDVPAVPQQTEDESSEQNFGGAHRRPSEPEPAGSGRRVPREEERPPQEGRRRAPDTPPPSPRLPWTPSDLPPPPPQRPEPAFARNVPTGPEWRPAPAEGQYIPAGTPGSNWAAPAGDNGTSASAAERDQPQVPPPPSSPPPATPTFSSPPPATSSPSSPPPAGPPPSPPPVPPPPVTPPTAGPLVPPAGRPTTPAMTPPPTEEPRRGRHYPAETAASESARRARHSSDADPGRPAPAPTLATPPPPPSAPSTPEHEEPAPRHREADDTDEPAGQHIGGQPVSELMARLQVGSTGGGHRRRRED